MDRWRFLLAVFTLRTKSQWEGRPGEHSRDDTLRAEVLWALKINLSHYSYSLSDDIAILLLTMFPDSAISSKFTCGELKYNYVLRFGLASYFKSALTDSLKVCSDYVLLFDESYNAVTKNKQIDIFVRYWNDQRVSSCYLQSNFMRHRRTQDILEHFPIGIGDLELKRVTPLQEAGWNSTVLLSSW